MSEEIILDDWSPSSETLKSWAYDENLFLSDQDEDLVLGHRDYLPILLPIAADESCPKAEYILSSLDFYLMFLVLRGNENHLAEVEEAIEIASSLPSTKIQEWANLQRRRLRYKLGIGPIDRKMALLMGQELLNGICRNSDISIIGDAADEWTVQLSVPPLHRHKEKLFINKVTGRFTFER